MLLKTESRRTALLIHGAMVGTVDKLRRLSMLDQATKDAEISAYRTSAVSRVCELVQSEAARAAYCHVRDLVAQSRPITPGAVRPLQRLQRRLLHQRVHRRERR